MREKLRIEAVDLGFFEEKRPESLPAVPGAFPEETESGMKILRRLEPGPVSGERIAKIVSNPWYVRESDLILDLADDLTRDDSIFAVGVTDEEGRVKGMVVRRDLFNLLGRPFGRDVLRKQTVSSVISPAKVFRRDENIFSVGEIIDRETQEQGIKYFLLTDERERYAGMFSTKDMLIYLSNITKQDLLLARRIQTRIVKEFERIREKRFDFVGASLMAKGVGGDFYAVKCIGDSRWLLSVCDVSGKGMAASLISSVLSGVINSYDFRRGLPGFLKTLNGFLTRTFELEKYSTGLFVELQAATGEVRIFDMGHSHLFLYRRNSLVQVKGPASNLPLGLTEDFSPAGYRFRLQSGDVLFLVSDGLLEQTDRTGKEYSPERMRRILTRNPAADLDSIKVLILEDFHSFRGPVSQHDDVTLLMLRYKD